MEDKNQQTEGAILLTPFQLTRGHRWLNDAAVLNYVFIDLLARTLVQILVYSSLVLVSLNVDLDGNWKKKEKKKTTRFTLEVRERS